MQPTTRTPGTANRQRCAEERAERLEGVARAKLESDAGRCLTDAEWVRARSRLLQFAMILYGWDRLARTKETGADNVVVVRRPAA